MQANKTIWRRVGFIVVLLPVCFFFPFMLLVIAWLIWTLYQDLKTPSIIPVPPAPTWRDAKADDKDWLVKFCAGCESPAEERFLLAMVRAFDLKPARAKLVSPSLTLEMQVNVGHYRFDFLANGRQVIEIDGAAWHSSPEQIERDRIRDDYSLEQGYKVLRIPAKLVFDAPDQAIHRVKTALALTPHFTRPVKPPSLAPRKSLSRYLNAFAEGVAALDRHVTIASTKHSTMADFKLAISTEQMLLAALVSEVEHDIRIEEMPLLARKNYEVIKAKLETQQGRVGKASRHEVYCWKEIIKPPPVNDAEIQAQIERTYQNDMEERQQRLALLKERCSNDPVFNKRLRTKMDEAHYLPADMITHNGPS